jgi:hypothetical protein
MSEFKIEHDERGFLLIVYTAGGDRLAHPISDPEALYDHVKAAIGPWLRERDEARATLPHVDEHGFATSGAEWPQDITPKHPDYHSIHADIYDQREGK